jgi:hypothetical protein
MRVHLKKKLFLKIWTYVNIEDIEFPDEEQRFKKVEKLQQNWPQEPILL